MFLTHTTPYSKKGETEKTVRYFLENPIFKSPIGAVRFPTKIYDEVLKLMTLKLLHLRLASVGIQRKGREPGIDKLG